MSVPPEQAVDLLSGTPAADDGADGGAVDLLANRDRDDGGMFEEMRRIVLGGIRDAGQQLLEGTEDAARFMESVVPLGSITTAGHSSEFVAERPWFPSVPSTMEVKEPTSPSVRIVSPRQVAPSQYLHSRSASSLTW